MAGMATERDRSAGPHTGERATSDVLVAVVYGVRRINFITAASDEDELFGRLARYVDEWSELQLYPSDAGRVRELLETGDASAAVRHYFASAGRRWDREDLVVRRVVRAV